jgi:hypothetical protein
MQKINMIVMFPWEFRIATGGTNSKDEVAAQLMPDPQQSIFVKLDESKHRHLRALYTSRFINRKSMSSILVDRGDVVNIMSMATFRRLGKGPKDLIKTNAILNGFEGGTYEAEGVLNVELTIRSKMTPTSFSLIAGRDHTTCCIEGIGFTRTIAYRP